MTRTFGRGIDFPAGETDVKAAGGLHVIQAFISPEESEEIQIKGRAARQGGVGSYEMIIDEDDLANIAGMTVAAVVDGRTPIETAGIINKIRNALFEDSYSIQIAETKKCVMAHLAAKEVISHIKKGQNDEVRKAINLLNKIDIPAQEVRGIVRTVIGIDATGSMQSAIKQVLANTKACLERTCEILKSDPRITNGFEIQMAVYRNYSDEAANLFQWSPFSNTAHDLITFLGGVQASGGYGRNEAVELVYDHALRFEKHVNQIIIIGDAAGNTTAEIKGKRAHKGEDYWNKSPRFADALNSEKLIEELANKKIVVHGFYIGQKPAGYFQEVCKVTGGQCQQYDYSHEKATELLTNFIVTNILNKVGGVEYGPDLVTAYKLRYPL